MKEKIRKEIFKLQDKKYKEFHKGLCPGIENIIGVRVPVLRDYAKKLIKENELNKLLINIDDKYYEEKMLQGMLIGLERKISFIELEKLLVEFVPKIDNWAICDTFCSGLKITKKYKKEMWDFLNKYINSDKEFAKRFAVVMILDYYIDEENIEKSLFILDNVKSDKYYVQMAIAWAISICLIKFYDKTITYLKSSNCKLDDFTYNKAIQKAVESYRISNEQKECLRNLKR